MVRFLNLVFLSLISTAAVHAKEGFYCIPSMKSTWIFVEKKADVVTIVVKNPMGYEQMPQFDGPTSQSSLPFQRMQFDDLKALGREFVLEWPAEQCEYNNKEKTIFCNGAATKKTAGIESYGLATVQITEKYKTETYQKNRYRFNFEKDGNIYFTSLDFFNSTCENLKTDTQSLIETKTND